MPPTHISFGPGGLSHLLAPACIHCERGTLWITCEGDACDYLLETGDVRENSRGAGGW